MPKCDFNNITNLAEITLRHGCSPVSLLQIFRTSVPKNTSGRLLLELVNENNFLPNFLDIEPEIFVIWIEALNNSGTNLILLLSKREFSILLHRGFFATKTRKKYFYADPHNF